MCGLDVDEIYGALEEVKDFAREKLDEIETLQTAATEVAEALEAMINE